MTIRFGPDQGRSEHRRLGSVPSVGLEPTVNYPPLRGIPTPPARHLLPVADQTEFSAWARRANPADDVATVAELAVIAAAEQEFTDDVVFPPSPPLRIKWRRVLAWSPILALAGLGAVTAARYVVHHPLAYWAVAFTAVYFACQVTPDGRP